MTLLQLGFLISGFVVLFVVLFFDVSSTLIFVVWVVGFVHLILCFLWFEKGEK